VIDHYLNDVQDEERAHEKGKSEFSITQGIGGLTKVLFMDQNGAPTNTFRSGDKVCIRFYYHFKEKVVAPSVGIVFNHSDHRYSLVSSTDYIFNLHSGYDGFDIPSLEGDGYFEVVIDCLYIPVGVYKYLTYLFLDNNMNLVQKNENAGEIEILWKDKSPKRSLIELPHEWAISEGNKADENH